MEDTLTVFIEGLEFYAFHGVSAEERVIGHRYRVDLQLRLQSRAATTDRVEDSIDYGDVSKRITVLGQAQRYETVERLAGIISDDLFTHYPLLEWLSVRVAKRLPPAPVVVELAGVELIRQRS